jgi:hypothetical protein
VSSHPPGNTAGVAQIVTTVVALLAFAGIYAVLARRRGGQVQWGWIAAVLACAGVAIVLSFFM